MQKFISILTLPILCSLISSCNYIFKLDKEYHIDSDRSDGGLTLDIDWLETKIICSFSNDSIPEGGYITYNKTPDFDGSPVRVYYVAPDSIFIITDIKYDSNKITSSESSGFNIITIDRETERVVALPNAINNIFTVTYPNGDKTIYTYPDSLTDNFQSDNFIRKLSFPFINNYTYDIEIFNNEIFVYDSDGKEIKRNRIKEKTKWTS